MNACLVVAKHSSEHMKLKTKNRNDNNYCMICFLEFRFKEYIYFDAKSGG